MREKKMLRKILGIKDKIEIETLQEIISADTRNCRINEEEVTEKELKNNEKESMTSSDKVK